MAQTKVRIFRYPKSRRCMFVDHFREFHKVDVIIQIFGETVEDVLQNLKVEFTEETKYMKVSSDDGHLLINPHYFNTAKTIDVYLDVIHELVHVKQFLDGKQLFDENFCYVDRPTEIEAYRITVEEARTIGLSDEFISKYLRSDLMEEEEFKRLAKNINLNRQV